MNDSILDFNPENFDNAIDANCKYIIHAVHRLMSLGLLHNKASICIVSSIWQELSRSNKLSYSVSKAALKGLVLSLVADLAPFGIRINAVLPGPIDNKMTRTNLSPSQLKFWCRYVGKNKVTLIPHGLTPVENVVNKEQFEEEPEVKQEVPDFSNNESAF